MASRSLLVNPPNASLPLVNPTTGAPAIGSGGLSVLQGYADALNGTSGVAGPNVNQIKLGIQTNMSAGPGSPEGVVVGSPGDMHVSTTGGAGSTLYIKETGVGTKTGWAAK